MSNKQMEEITTAPQNIENPHGEYDKQLDSTNRGRHWCLTINNWFPQELEVFDKLYVDKNLAYYVAGKEVGESGTPHLQCYLYTTKNFSFTQVKNWFPRARIAPKYKKATPQQAANYCKKDEDYIEDGILPEPQFKAGAKGTQIKWETVKELAQKGDLDSIEPKVFVQNYRTLKQIAMDFQTKAKELEDVCGEWIYGKPGVGKSYTARKENPDLFDKPINKWWDNYNNEACVLLDDFPKDGTYMTQFLKRWGDRYPFPAEIKNHVRQIRPQKIVVTSNYHPSDIFKDDDLEAILRRFKVRKIEKIQQMDLTHAPKKPKLKRRRSPSPPKKPPLYRQNANGDIVLNKTSQIPIERIIVPDTDEDEDTSVEVLKHPNLDDLVDCACFDGDDKSGKSQQVVKKILRGNL